MMEDHHRERVPTEATPIQFGAVPLPPALEAFRRLLNGEVMALLRSLPKPVHTDAVIGLMKHFGTPFFPEFDFFGNYYPPAWSVLYWLEKSHGRLSPDHRRNAHRAHAMALLLHPLDDHLNDGQLPPTHVHLLLRSEAWRRMCSALEALSGDLPGGSAIVEGCLEAYYASIAAPAQEETVDGYCRHFRGQMATWTCVPRLMAARIANEETFTEVVEEAFVGFGTAWRLLDDLQDAAVDYQRRHHSAVYCALPPDAKAAWDGGPPQSEGPSSPLLWAAARQHAVANRLMDRIRLELDASAALLDTIGMGPLAGEMRSLATPFRSAQEVR